MSFADELATDAGKKGHRVLFVHISTSKTGTVFCIINHSKRGTRK